VPNNKRQKYMRNRHIIAGALSGQPLKQAAKANGVSPGLVTQLLNRCLGGDGSCPPALTHGLIPYAQTSPGRRKHPLPTLTAPSGARYAFLELLEVVPGLKKGLDQVILSKLEDQPTAQRLTPRAFHGAFKLLLAEAHWPTDRYPFTEPSIAYESVRRYLRDRAQTLDAERQMPKRRSELTQGMFIQSQHSVLGKIQLDEHLLDVRKHVQLLLDEQFARIPIARVSVLVMVEVECSCILGFYVALTSHPDRLDLLNLIDLCINPWQPMTLTTPGLSYLKGAMFPSSLSDDLPITFGTVQLDNAMMHRARAVKEVFCDQLGATLNYGFPAMPKIRALVESVFRYINEHCTHQFASTTGSHPKDPIRESKKNHKNIPVISLRTLEEALSVILSEYNARPRAELGNATPLEAFRRLSQAHYVRHIPPDFAQSWQPFMGKKVVPLKWYRHEKRGPCVNFLYLRYQGHGLINVQGHKKRVLIQYDRRDIRTIHAYTLEGDDLGELHAPKTWQRFAHSVLTRKVIYKELKAGRLQMRDPLGGYFRNLIADKDTPKHALQIIRIYKEYTQNEQKPLNLGHLTRDNAIIESGFKHQSVSWSTDTANRRKS
jgi:hypothetical protein